MKTTKLDERDTEFGQGDRRHDQVSRRLERRRGRVVRIAIAFVAFVCLALLSMNAWLITRARATEIEQIDRANTNLARAVSQQIEGSITLAEHLLSSIVFELERSVFTPDSLLRLQPMLVTQVAETPSIKGLFVYDARGKWLVHSEASDDPSRNNSDRSYFIYHRDNPSTRPLVSDPIVSRSSGEWVIPLSRRISDPDGKFAGVVLATLSVKHLRALLDRFQIGEEGAIALFRADRLILRRPFREADIGRRNTTSALRQLFEAQGAGTVEGKSTIDGVKRIISFEHLVDYPLLVTVAVGKEEALQDWRSASIYQTAWVAVLCLIVAGGGGFLIQSMRRRLLVEQHLRISRGDLTRANARLEHLAQVDGLTGLSNRRFFDTRLASEFEQARVLQRPLAVVMVDVDEFKKYNDQYGHLQGDACLRSVALALRSALRREGDFVARYGGEEMVFLLPDTDASTAAVIAERARNAVLGLQIAHVASKFGQVSVSMGVAAWTPTDKRMIGDLLQGADSALYRAKDGGRNRVEVAEP